MDAVALAHVIAGANTKRLHDQLPVTQAKAQVEINAETYIDQPSVVLARLGFPCPGAALQRADSPHSVIPFPNLPNQPHIGHRASLPPNVAAKDQAYPIGPADGVSPIQQQLPPKVTADTSHRNTEQTRPPTAGFCGGGGMGSTPALRSPRRAFARQLPPVDVSGTTSSGVVTRASGELEDFLQQNGFRTTPNSLRRSQTPRKRAGGTDPIGDHFMEKFQLRRRLASLPPAPGIPAPASLGIVGPRMGITQRETTTTASVSDEAASSSSDNDSFADDDLSPRVRDDVANLAPRPSPRMQTMPLYLHDTRLVPPSDPQTSRAAGVLSHPWGAASRLNKEAGRNSADRHHGSEDDSDGDGLEMNGQGWEALRALDLSEVGQLGSPTRSRDEPPEDAVSSFVQGLTPSPAFAARVYRCMPRPVPPTPASINHSPIPLWPPSAIARSHHATPRVARPTPRAVRSERRPLTPPRSLIE
jgi:hypothetical protein